MIRILEKKVADKIAAGEVIDRPVSIVKELVENSLDAEASSVTVEIKNGGKSYIRVTDDGCGISAEDAELAFHRHATSKISDVADLDHIASLGFRGEALASICAVARVEMITRQADSNTGRRLICEGSRVLTNEATGCPEGTTITVSDLFYNIPARLKFLGSDGGEARRVIDVVSRIALSYPDVRFRLISGNKDVFRTSGKGSIYDSILRIYGKDIAEDLVPVDAARGGMRLRGFISSPGTSTSSRSRQFFCVNGRIVSSKTMERGLEKAYRERLFTGRFPVAFLFLTVPSDTLDVNVHPTKKEVRFDDGFLVEDFITESVAAALEEKDAIPRVKAETQSPAQPAAGQNPEEQGSAEAIAYPKQPEGEQVDIKNFLHTLREETEEYEACSEAAPDQSSEEAAKDRPSEEQTAQAPDFADTAAERLEIEDLRVLGVVFSTYIIAEDGQCVYLIDQHAAHERVFYESLLKQYHAAEKPQQTMLIPLQVSVSADVENTEDSWIGFLRDMGYDIEFFGNRTYIVRAMPAFANPEDGERFLKQMLLEFEHKPDMNSFASLDALITRSCKSAVKGGDTLRPEEIDALLAQLSRCGNPWSCPHGRPTIVRLTEYELKKMFKRV